jgi:DNA-binding transcriptional MerR regulator
MQNLKKIVYTKLQTKSNAQHGKYQNKAYKDILEKDRAGMHSITSKKEKKELFGLITDDYYRRKGLNIKEVREILAELKYNNDNHFSRKEIDRIAKELGSEIGQIKRKHFTKKRRDFLKKQKHQKSTKPKKVHPFAFGQHSNSVSGKNVPKGDGANNRIGKVLDRVKSSTRNSLANSKAGQIADPYANLSSGNKGDGLQRGNFRNGGQRGGLNKSGGSLRGKNFSSIRTSLH